MDRFYDKVSKRENGCWEWQGATRDTGYGVFRIDGKLYSAHRVSAYLAGKCGLNCRCPKTDIVLHDCDNPLCVNPDHLIVGSQKENIQQSIERGRWGGAGNFAGWNRGQLKHQDKMSRIKTLHAQGLSVREIVEATDVPRSTVRRYLSL